MMKVNECKGQTGAPSDECAKCCVWTWTLRCRFSLLHKGEPFQNRQHAPVKSSMTIQTTPCAAPWSRQVRGVWSCSNPACMDTKVRTFQPPWAALFAPFLIPNIQPCRVQRVFEHLSTMLLKWLKGENEIADCKWWSLFLRKHLGVHILVCSWNNFSKIFIHRLALDWGLNL